MTERTSGGTILVLLLVGLLVFVPLLGMTMWGPMMMGGGMMGGWGCPFSSGWGWPGAGWGSMWVGVFLPLFLIGLLIVGAYLLLAPRWQARESETALNFLNERYAKGEITKEQYLEMKEQLNKR